MIGCLESLDFLDWEEQEAFGAQAVWIGQRRRRSCGNLIKGNQFICTLPKNHLGECVAHGFDDEIIHHEKAKVEDRFKPF